MKIEWTYVLFISGKIINLIMRTFIFLFCAALFSLSPEHTMSQNDKIVIGEDMEVSVDKVFKIIKAQTDYSFVYHENLFKSFPMVELKKGRIQVNKLLRQSLLHGDVNVIFTANSTIIIKNNSKSQQISVSGKVTDESGMPVPGVTVLIKGTTKGTLTDTNGYYTIKVPDPANVLVFSYVSYEKYEITAGTQSVINVSLKESITELDVITISARYYNNSQKEETGAVSKIDARVIEKQPVNNLLATMQGHIPSVNISQNTGVPGSNFRIRIRGENFINEGPFSIDNDPLYVIDGVPYNSTSLENVSSLAGGIIGSGGVSPLNAINPGDIKSIEVLKDADATAIYGSRGANGVVLITTKKGRIGKTQIKVNLSTSLSEVTNFVDLLNTNQYLEVRKETIENEGYNLEEPLPGFISSALQDVLLWDNERNIDWQKTLIGNAAYRQNVQISFSGGNENTQFLLSGGYVGETTVFIGDSKYEKTSMHVSITHKSKNDRFGLNFSGNYGADNNNLPGNDLTRQSRVLPSNAPPLYNDQGNLNHWDEISANNSFIKNPLIFLESQYNAKNRSIIANTLLSYNLTKALELKTSFGYTDYRLDSYLAQPHTRFSPNIIQGQSSKYSRIKKNIGARKSWIIEPQVNWHHNLGSFKLKLLFGASFQKDRDEQLRISGEDFSSNSLLLNLAAAGETFIDLDTSSEYKYQSFFGRVNVNWNDKYFLNLTGRRDGSSRFGPGRQFGLFGAIGAAWIFSEENFLKNNAILSFGKLRASYGITGADTSPNYAFYDSYDVSGNYNGSGLEPSRLFNPDFRWEETTKMEAAIELGFFDNRIFLSTSWYCNRSSNQLTNRPLPSTTGFSSVSANLDAIVENKGFEVELRSLNIQAGKFNWRTTFNISANRNKLVAFPNLEGSTFANRLVIGEPLNINRLYNFLGVDAETGIYQFEDFNNDGVINGNDNNEKLVDLTPKYFGGFGNTLSYNNFQLDVFFQFINQKSKTYNSLHNFDGSTIGNVPTTVLNRWQQVGDLSAIQAYYLWTNQEARIAADRYAFSTASVTDASFIRLRNVSLSYSVPKKVTKNLDVNIYLQGQNLFVLTGYDGADPEVKSLSTLPPLRQFTLGLNLSF